MLHENNAVDILEGYISNENKEIITEFLDECFYMKETGIENPLQIPWRWSPSTTTPKFPQFSHNMFARESEKPISPFFKVFDKAIEDFMDQNSLDYKGVIRSCLNCTYHIPDVKCFDPHVDCYVNHYNVIIYLNNSVGNTVIFDHMINYDDEEQDGIIEYGDIDWDNNPLPVKQEITPEFGKVVVFNGRYFHSMRPSLPGQLRLINVQNLAY